MKNDIKAEILLLDLRREAAVIESINHRMAADHGKYGEWQCDYNEWMGEANRQYDMAREKLVSHLAGKDVAV